MTPSCGSTVESGRDHLKDDERAATPFCQRPQLKGGVENPSVALQMRGQECPRH